MSARHSQQPFEVNTYTSRKVAMFEGYHFQMEQVDDDNML